MLTEIVLINSTFQFGGEWHLYCVPWSMNKICLSVYLEVFLISLQEHFVISAFKSFMSFWVDVYGFHYFWITVSGFIFLILIFMCTLLVYRNTTMLYMLILYPVILLNSLTSFRKFLSLFPWDFHIICISKQIFLKTLYALYFFSCLCGLARYPSTMLDMSSESGSSFLPPDLRRKVPQYS